MRALSLALLADGTSDRALLPVLTWAMRSLSPAVRFFEPEFEVRRGDLAQELKRVAEKLHPDILFVHRDAERESLEARRAQIPMIEDGLVRVVPVRMTEAWLLVDESAIRRAANNPNGQVDLEIPRVSRLESLPDPKATLREALLRASGHVSPRRRQRFQRDLGRCFHLVAEYTPDFSPLRQLAAYQAFEAELRQVLLQISARGTAATEVSGA
jgi:hypothetical protein